MKKRILVVAMLNSIHTARWLAQFKDRDLEIRIFPSAYYKELHPKISEMLEGGHDCSFTLSGPRQFSGYFDYLMNRILSRISLAYSRVARLNRCIRNFNPDVVHALEFQHAGYLCLDLIEKHGKSFELISTNWGSDIFHFQDFDDHKNKIIKLLEHSDKYSAECDRDISLARALGFSGQILPVVPNSGGFSRLDISKVRSIASTRRLLLVKSYGGYFGRAKLVIDLVPLILERFPEYSIYFYSVTDDLISSLKDLSKNFPGKIQYSTVVEPIPYAQLQNLFDASRIYVGCSISDGISTSFLEALVSGAYPIQTSTSCAGEWISKGATASLVPLDGNEIYSAIERALSDDLLVNHAQQKNQDVALKFLDGMKISKEVQVFY